MPAPEIAGQLLSQPTRRQCEKVAAELAPAGVELDRLLRLPEGDPTQLDLDSTPIEVQRALSEGAGSCPAAGIRSGQADLPSRGAASCGHPFKGAREVRMRADSGFDRLGLLSWCPEHRLWLVRRGGTLRFNA